MNGKTRAGKQPVLFPPRREDGHKHLPLHDDQQAFLPVIHVLVQADDADDVRPCRHSPVQLHLSSGLGAVIQNLGKQSEKRVRAWWKVGFLQSANPLLEMKQRKSSIFDEDRREKELKATHPYHPGDHFIEWINSNMLLVENTGSLTGCFIIFTYAGVEIFEFEGI